MPTATAVTNQGTGTVLFKSCARCHGDRTVERDNEGVYILCLMCGHVAYPEVGADQHRPARRHGVAA